MNTHLEKRAEITAKAWVVNLVAIPVALVVTGLVVLGAVSLPHQIPLGGYDLLLGLGGLILLLSAHELIHAQTLRIFDHLPWSAFKFGFLWRQLVLYCHCRHPVTIQAFRRCALGPLLTLGPLTLLATLFYPAIWLALITGVHLSGCIGDIWIYIRSRPYPAHFLFQDFPDRLGGAVFEPVPQSTPALGQP